MKSLEKTEILHWLAQVLKPLLRIALNRGAKLNDMLEVLKMSLVELAYEELQKSKTPPSDSKVSAITGVHRRDVKRLHPSQAQPKLARDLISRVMGQWQLDPQFRDKDTDRPKSLTVEGKDSEFAQLVSKMNGADISSYAVLYEMERLGVVEKKEGKLSLLWNNFIVDSDVRQSLRLLGSDLKDLVASVLNNVEAMKTRAARNLHLKTEFDNIPVEEIPELRAWLLEEGSHFHTKVRERLARVDRDIIGEESSGKERGRIAFCSFVTHDSSLPPLTIEPS